ncbi:Hypothetical protein, putative, partial [Bodo saltans]
MTWIAKLDGATGKTYYYNKETRETQWKKPDDYVEPAASVAAAPPPVVAPLATPVSASTTSTATSGDVWIEKLDQSSQKPYYYNKATRETTWVRPVNFVGAISEALTTGATATAQPVVVAPSSASATIAPNDDADVWQSKVDATSGKTYYYNKRTKEVTWSNPNLSAESVTASALSKKDEELGGTRRDPAAGATPQPSRHDTPNRQREDNSQPDVSASNVPEPWIEKVDPASKRHFYYNPITKETTWTMPAAKSSQVLAADQRRPDANATTSGGQWLEKMDASSGKPYYYNTETRETSWKRPTDMGNADATPSAAAAAAAPSGGQSPASPPAAKPPVPAAAPLSAASTKSSNWVRKVDYRSGQYMYHNVVTGETQWTDPSDAQPVLTLPLSAEAIFVIGGNAKPTPAQQDRQPPGTTFQTVEMLDGKQWNVLQASFLAEKVPQSVLPVQVLPCDVDDITVIHTSRTECVIFGKRTLDHAPFCMQWNSETLQRTNRFDLQGLVAYGAAFSAVANGVIATGGYLDESMQNVASDAIVIDFHTSRPFLLPRMNIKRANHAIAVLDLSNSERLMWFAYVFGGFDGERKSSSVERYVAGKSSWEVMEDMPLARSGHAAVVVDRTIYVLGGRSGYKVLHEVHSMHVQSDHWRNVRPMHHARCNFGAVY